MLELGKALRDDSAAPNLVRLTRTEIVSMSTKAGPKEAAVSWRLQDAKARFSEVVRLARDEGPQRVTVHGRDAVVVVDAATFDRARERHTGARLVRALRASPLGDVDLERVSVAGPVRDVEL
jgi:prevent-host-death family protein